MSATHAATHEASSAHESHDDGTHAHAGAPELPIFALAFTIIVGACMFRIKDMIPIPFTVIMLIYGLAIGGLMHLWPWFDEQLTVFSDIDPHVIIGVFIPPLIFEGSAALKWTVLSRVLPQCLILAVPGVLINTGLVALFLKLALFPEWSWTFALLIGSTLSATDPVAVVATLRDLDADLAVTILTDGEAIMNDGTSIVIFNVLLPAAAGSVVLDAQFFGLNFNLLFGGPFLGIFLGVILFAGLRVSRGNATVSAAFQVAGSYAAFYIAERLCLTSGVITVMVMALYVSRKRGSLTRIDEEDGAVHAFWEILVWMANTLLFFIVGLIVARDGIPNATGFDWLALLATYPMLFVVRAFMLGLLRPVLNLLGVRVTWQRYVMLIHGALRGGIALALALVIFGEHDIKEEYRVSALFLTSGIVVLTIMVNGTTAKLVVNFLKINIQPRFARYANKRAEQEVLALLEVGIRKAKYESRIQLNWPALKQMTVDAFNEARDPCDVHATEDVVVPIVLRATKREVWQQRDSGMLSAAAFDVIMAYLDNCIQNNSLYDVSALRDFVVEHPPIHSRFKWLSNSEEQEDGTTLITRKASPDMCLLESEVIATFADVMEPISHTVTLLFSRKHSIHDFANWCEHQRSLAEDMVEDMQHSVSHGRAMINIQTKRAASKILWDARRSVDRIRDMTGLSINQTHNLNHKMHHLIHHVKATPTLDLKYTFAHFLRSLSLFDNCTLTDEQIAQLALIFADDAVDTGDVLSLEKWKRQAPHTYAMSHTFFCADGDDPCAEDRHGLTRNFSIDVGLSSRNNSQLANMSELVTVTTAADANKSNSDIFDPASTDAPSPGATSAATSRRRRRMGASTNEPFTGGNESTDGGSNLPSPAAKPKRRPSMLACNAEETVSGTRRRASVLQVRQAARRVHGRDVFGIVLLGSIAKTVGNRIRHKSHAGDYFGLLRALSDRAGTQQYVALERSEILVGDVAKFRKFLEDFPELANKVWLNMAITLVDGILASVYPTAELPAFERLALAKRGRLILVNSYEPVLVPAFSSGFLLSGNSIDDPSPRCKVSAQLAAASKSANPNLSARAGHLIPPEISINYAPGSYIFVLDDVPLLESRAFPMTHLPFLDAGMLQMNLGVTSFVRSLFQGQDRIASLFRIVGDVMGLFPVLANLIDAARMALAKADPVRRDAMLADLAAKTTSVPPTRSNSICNPAASKSTELPPHAGSKHAFVTAEDNYDGDNNETDRRIQRSVKANNADAEHLDAHQLGAAGMRKVTIASGSAMRPHGGRKGGDDDIEEAVSVDGSAATAEGGDDVDALVPYPEVVETTIEEHMTLAAAEVRGMHSYVHQVLLQQYTSQVRVRGVVQRIADFFRVFQRTPTPEDASSRARWVRALYHVIGHDHASVMYSLSDAKRALVMLVSVHGLSSFEPDAADTNNQPQPESPVETALKDDPFNEKPIYPTAKFAAFDRVVSRLPHAVSSAAFGQQRTAPPRRTEKEAMEAYHAFEGDDDSQEPATPSLLEGRGSLVRRNSLHGTGSFTNGSFANGGDAAGMSFGGTQTNLNLTARGASLEQQSTSMRDENLMAAVNDFDE